MKIFILLATTSLFASSNDWKSHKTCFHKLSPLNGECRKIIFNTDKRITKKNKIKNLHSHICKVSQFKYDFHFEFVKKAITIEDIDIRKFLHRDFKQTSNSHSMSCIRKLNMHLGEFNRKAKRIYSCKRSQNDFSEVHIINNCREPGNYEFKFFNNKKLSFKAHTLFPRSFYEQILKEYTSSYGQEISIDDSHIGFTKAHSFQTKDEQRENQFYLSNPVPNFSELQNENNCSIKELKSLTVSSKTISQGRIEVKQGQIPFNEFDKEVKTKSGYSKKQEPLSYIRTPCKKDQNYTEQLKLKAPNGLNRYSSYSNDNDAWLRSECKYIPYLFKTYKQLTTYNSAFSAFEVDCIYTGKTSNGGSKSNRNSSRWDANLYHLKNLVHYEIDKTRGSLRNLKLINKEEGISIIIGNIDLNLIRNKSISFLMGIDSQKLVSQYNSKIFKEKRPLFSFTFDSKNGEILNQHNLQKVGFEKVWLRLKGKNLIVDLISHERIVPVWRGIIKNIK